MDTGFFLNEHTFGISGSLDVGRVQLPGISLDSDQTFFVFLTVIFALVAIGLLALRRGRYGRRLRALADSPAASATVGMNLTATKLTVFAISAGLAGLGGALDGQQQGLVGEPDFQLLLSLTLVLLAVVWGIRTMTGMLVAGLLFAFFPVIQSHFPALRDLLYLGTGLAAIGIGRNPERRLRGKHAAATKARQVRAPRPPRRRSSSRARTTRARPPVLRVEEISVRFGGVHAVDQLTLGVGAGTITGLIGPNGAGKTTPLQRHQRTAAAETRGPRRARRTGTSPSRCRRRGARAAWRETFQRLEVFGSMTARENISRS